MTSHAPFRCNKRSGRFFILALLVGHGQVGDSFSVNKIATTSPSRRVYSSFQLEQEPDLPRLDNLHATLESLREQLPTLLTTPLTAESSRSVYNDYVQLIVDDSIVLASSREELVALSTTLVLAVTATNQANSFLTTNMASSGKQPTQQQQQPQASTVTTLQCRMAIDPSMLQAIRVQWKVQLPSLIGQQQQLRQIQGVSELVLDPTYCKVDCLKLLQVKWNDEPLNARAIAENLASLRQLVMVFQKSPLLAGGLLPSLSSMLTSDILQQVTGQQQQQQQQKSATIPSERIDQTPLFVVVGSLQTAFMANTTESAANAMIPIDEYDISTVASSASPLPGSKLWSRYAACRRMFDIFCHETLPALSGNNTIASNVMLEMFSPLAQLVAMDDKEVLLEGRDPVGTFFHTVASWRKRSSGKWDLVDAPLLNWTNDDNEMTIVVNYRASSYLPGFSKPVVLEGTDHFILDTSELSLRKTANDDDDIKIVVKRVEQQRLEITVGSGTSSRPTDGLWFVKRLVDALDAGRLTSVGGDSVVMELLQRAIAGDMNGGRGVINGVDDRKQQRRRTPPKLSDATAARVYKIMMALHQDVPSLFDREMPRVYQLPPLHEFMNEKVELRGYLGETLARGRQAYNRAVGTTFASLKGSIVTGGIRLDREPSVDVELTADGYVRLKLSIDLSVFPLPIGTSGILNSIGGTALSLPSAGFPLKLSIVSNYVVDKETGDIFQHRLVETRINGQLTPGDIVSRWIQRQVMSASDSVAAPSNEAIVQRGLMDAIIWVKSMTSRG